LKKSSDTGVDLGKTLIRPMVFLLSKLTGKIRGYNNELVHLALKVKRSSNLQCQLISMFVRSLSFCNFYNISSFVYLSTRSFLNSAVVVFVLLLYPSVYLVFQPVILVVYPETRGCCTLYMLLLIDTT
jgi:hypothetical protein